MTLGPPSLSSFETADGDGVLGSNQSIDPTSAPSDPSFNVKGKCSPDADGLFGKQNDKKVEVDFMYELEFVPGSDVQGSLLPSIEQANVEAVLPSFFASKCGVRRLRSHRSNRRYLEAVGVSSFPNDEILDGVECDERNIVNKTNDCVVVEGKITVYVSGDVEAERATIEKVLKTTMDKKDLVSPNGAVDRITWIGLARTGRSQAAQATGDRMNAILFLLIIVMSALVLAVIIALVVRYKRRQRRTRRDRNIDDDAKALMAGKTSW